MHPLLKQYLCDPSSPIYCHLFISHFLVKQSTFLTYRESNFHLTDFCIFLKRECDKVYFYVVPSNFLCPRLPTVPPSESKWQALSLSSLFNFEFIVRISFLVCIVSFLCRYCKTDKGDGSDGAYVINYAYETIWESKHPWDTESTNMSSRLRGWARN